MSLILNILSEEIVFMVMFFTLLLMGVGLSMDAFAVSICKGLSMRKVNKKQCLVIGLFFGGFQALMPFIGWVLGSQFEQYITSIDHWIAFILLGFIGGKMVVEAIRETNRKKGKRRKRRKSSPATGFQRDVYSGNRNQH